MSHITIFLLTKPTLVRANNFDIPYLVYTPRHWLCNASGSTIQKIGNFQRVGTTTLMYGSQQYVKAVLLCQYIVW